MNEATPNKRKSPSLAYVLAGLLIGIGGTDAVKRAYAKWDGARTDNVRHTVQIALDCTQAPSPDQKVDMPASGGKVIALMPVQFFNCANGTLVVAPLPGRKGE